MPTRTGSRMRTRLAKVWRRKIKDQTKILHYFANWHILEDGRFGGGGCRGGFQIPEEISLVACEQGRAQMHIKSDIV